MDFTSNGSLSDISTTSSGSDVGFYGGRKISISSNKPSTKKSRKARRSYLTNVKPPPTADEPEFYPLEPRNTTGDNSRQRKQQTVYLIPSPTAYTPSSKWITTRAPVPCMHLTANRFIPALSSTKSDIRPTVERDSTPGPGTYTCPTTGRGSQLRRAPAYSF